MLDHQKHTLNIDNHIKIDLFSYISLIFTHLDLFSAKGFLLSTVRLFLQKAYGPQSA